MFHHFHCFCVFSFFWLTLCINKSQNPLQTTNLCNIFLFLSLTVSILLSAVLSHPLIATNERRNAFAIFLEALSSFSTSHQGKEHDRLNNKLEFTIYGLIGVCFGKANGRSFNTKFDGLEFTPHEFEKKGL
ncbi:hypothetical protein P8452_51560 [Trifolium repens]|nr:hypothetical protein P8452_51560 [Trifolium repens]